MASEQAVNQNQVATNNALEQPLGGRLLTTLEATNQFARHGTGAHLLPAQTLGQVAMAGANQTIQGNPFAASSYFGPSAVTQAQMGSGQAAGGGGMAGGGGSPVPGSAMPFRQVQQTPQNTWGSLFGFGQNGTSTPFGGSSPQGQQAAQQNPLIGILQLLSGLGATPPPMPQAQPPAGGQAPAQAPTGAAATGDNSASPGTLQQGYNPNQAMPAGGGK